MKHFQTEHHLLTAIISRTNALKNYILLRRLRHLFKAKFYSVHAQGRHC